MNPKPNKILTKFQKLFLAMILIVVIVSPLTNVAYGATMDEIPRVDGAAKSMETMLPDNTSVTDLLGGIGGTVASTAIPMGLNVLSGGSFGVMSGIMGALGGSLGGAVGGTAAEMLLNIVKAINHWLRAALSWITRLFEQIAHMQEFLTEPVNVAWRVVRDFVNMFFAIALLFIAVATASNISALSSYSAKSMLPSLITAAILVNFSKAITLMFIDISQIFFITFYNAATNDGAYSVGDLIASQAALDQLTVTNWAEGTATNSLMAALMMMVCIMLVMSIFLWSTFILLYRLVAFWVLIAVSPLAFVGSVIKPLHGVWNEWSKTMSTVCTSVPILMFFIYLSVVIVTPASYSQVPYNIASENVELRLAELPTFFNSHAYLAYALALAFLFYANTLAMKGGEAAPGFIKGAINGTMGFATGGLAGYMNMSTWKTHQMAQKSAGAVGSGLKTADKGFDTVLPDYRRLKRNVADTARKGDLGKSIPVVGGAAAFGAQLATKEGRETLKDYSDMKAANDAIKNNRATLQDYSVWSKGVKTAQERELAGKDVPSMLKELPGVISEAKKGDARSIALLSAMEKQIFSDETEEKDKIKFAEAVKAEGYGTDTKGNPRTNAESIRALNEEVLGNNENFAKDLQKQALKSKMYSFAGIAGEHGYIDSANGKGSDRQVVATDKLKSLEVDDLRIEGDRLLQKEGKTGSGLSRGLVAIFGNGQAQLLSDKDVQSYLDTDTREDITKDLKANADLTSVLKDLKNAVDANTKNVTPDKKEAYEKAAVKNFWSTYTAPNKDEMQTLYAFAKALDVKP